MKPPRPGSIIYVNEREFKDWHSPVNFDIWADRVVYSGLHRLGADIGVPASKENCQNCGAPWEPHRCSYCLTPK